MDFRKYMPSEKTAGITSIVVVAIAVIYMAVNIYSHRSTKYVDDFKIYYYTGKAFNDGLNPYEASSINKEAGFDLKTIYRYAPYTFYVFGLMAKLKYDTALAVFMGLKASLAVCLFLLWMKYFIKEKYSLVFAVFFVIGFNSAIYIDLKFANISIFEQIFIWGGLYFFLQKKNILFTVCIIASAMFKFWPILLLFAYLAGDARKNFKNLIISFGLFAAIQGVLYLLMPGLYPSFVNSSPIGEAGGSHNVSSYLFFKDLFAGVNLKGMAGFIPLALYFSWALIFTAAAVLVLVKHTNNSVMERIFFILVTYCLIVPRMKDYSFIMLLPVAYYFVTQAIKSKWSLLVLVLFSENMICFFAPPLICGYYYLMVLVAIWVFGLIVLRGDVKNASSVSTGSL